MRLSSMFVVLNDCIRSENRDHAFGDVEVFWDKPDGTPVAAGYFNSDGGSVWSEPNPGISFSGEDAKHLRQCGTLGEVGRNDETGPSMFTEGSIVPGLTREGVRSELAYSVALAISDQP